MEMNDLDISNLSLQLKQEKLFVDSERHHLKCLNLKVMKAIENVYHSSYLRGELIANSNSTQAYCQKANLLTQLRFIDGYHVLGHNEPLFGDLLNGLRRNPKLCAHCLVLGENISQECMQSAASVIVSSIYSNCIFPEDEHYTLMLLKYLIELQLVPSENPRLLLHKGSCAFSKVFKAYIDTLPQAKVFLTAALHQPIMQLLMEDELYLDTDPAEAVSRFLPEERLQRFGHKDSPAYNEALSKYQLWIIKKLVKITNRFIESIKQAMHCFPTTLAWLVKTIYEVLLTHKRTEMREISAICVDVVFHFFLCSAIVTPEPHGISEAPISRIARFNLIQVAQILKVLAMNRWGSPDPRLSDLYSNFDKEKMSELIDSIIEQRDLDGPPVTSLGNLTFMGLSKSSCLIPETYLYSFINFLAKVLEGVPESSSSHKELEELLHPLKPQLHHIAAQCQTQASVTSSTLTPDQTNHGSATASASASHGSPSESPKKNILNKVKPSRKHPKCSTSTETTNENDDSFTHNLPVTPQTGSNGSVTKDEEDESTSINSLGYDTVLAVSLNLSCAFECPGMMTEEKVLLAAQAAKPPSRVRILDDDVVIASGSEGTIEKRTRFSLSRDEGSIGNTSDNLEAISEAASNHSVSSSLEDVEQADQPDNLSDMVSANVSGRGTPNVSGRDTPSSQVTDGDDGGRGPEASIQASNPVTMTKHASADIEEKFGRFEIKPVTAGDETVSMVSDTWSTDVLASDSETIEAAERENRGDEPAEFLDQHLKELDRMHGTGPDCFLRGGSAGETFETASEAWSTDVLASDSERLTEFDTDDAQSVARSDDTGRSEIEVELAGSDLLRPEGAAAANAEDNATPRVIASRSPVECLKSLKRDQESPVADALGEERGRDGAWSSVGGILKPSCLGNAQAMIGRHFIPVMQISEEGQPPNPDLTFRPIQDYDDKQVNTTEDMQEHPLLRESHSEAIATQSLGRLSLDLSDLPKDGLIPVDQPLLRNSFLKEGKLKTPEEKHTATKDDFERSAFKLSKRKTSEGYPKIVSVGSSAEDSSIHLSTASLASSSSSGSDVPHGVAARDQKKASFESMPHGENNLQTKEHLTLTNTLSAPPSNVSSTGAIPKSISFDKTAEKGDREALESESKHKRGFFKGFKLPGFKGRRKVMTSLNSRSDDFPLNRPFCNSEVGIRRSSSEDSRKPILEETSDDILAKYRKKPVDGSEVDSAASMNHLNGSVELVKPDEEDAIDIASTEVGSYAFSDAKRKLRLVLSSSDFCVSSSFVEFSPSSNSDSGQCCDIVTWLQMQLAEAQNLHNRLLVAQLHETLRCVQLFDHMGREKLLLSLKEDYQSRSSYVAYLVRSKQGLLNSVAHLEKLLSRIEADTGIIMDSMVNVCVRMFLERRDELLSNFTQKFTKLTASDEKVELVESFLVKLYQELERDPMWISSASEQLTLAQMSLERAIMSHIYIHALYPNGDADVSRDQVLHEHMWKLSNVVTPNHKCLRIPKMYQFECPWTSAQAQLSYLGAYKTAADKVTCIVRASQTVMNLLSMAHQTSVPAADDFIPVLVYIIVKANPPGLLSTIQYVNLFYEQRLQGEDQYWWAQFCSAVEFIKTMDYTV